jgi:hypothetical protein
MAKPIKETPYLFGKDAERFVEENKSVSKVSKEEKKEILESFNKFKEIANFEI